MTKKFIDQIQFYSDLTNSEELLRQILDNKECPCVPCEISKILKQDTGSLSHNCLGCSFNKILNNAHRTMYEHMTLSTSTTHGYEINREFLLYNTFHWLNLVVEQVKFIKEVIHLNGVNSDSLDTDKYFDGFRQVNKITNLFKHPKVFAFTHHLEYIFEYETPDMDKYEKVKFSDIFEYFTGSKKKDSEKKEYFERYANKIIAIELKPLNVLMLNFLLDFVKFVEEIRNNDEYIKILSNYSNL